MIWWRCVVSPPLTHSSPILCSSIPCPFLKCIHVWWYSAVLCLSVQQQKKQSLLTMSRELYSPGKWRVCAIKREIPNAAQSSKGPFISTSSRGGNINVSLQLWSPSFLVPCGASRIKESKHAHGWSFIARGQWPDHTRMRKRGAGASESVVLIPAGARKSFFAHSLIGIILWDARCY